MKRTAFTMIELIFVIVILGILSAIAIPRLGSTVDDANIAKGRSDVAAIRAAIVSERQGRLLQGQSNYISHLDHGSTTLFDDNDSDATNGSLLQYGITAGSGNGKWAKTTDDTYTYSIIGTPVIFNYTVGTGAFSCTPASTASTDPCRLLTN
jgi:general secretion pathway protein G